MWVRIPPPAPFVLNDLRREPGVPVDCSLVQVSIWVSVQIDNPRRSSLRSHYPGPRIVSMRNFSHLRSSRSGSGPCLRCDGGRIFVPCIPLSPWRSIGWSVLFLENRGSHLDHVVGAHRQEVTVERGVVKLAKRETIRDEGFSFQRTAGVDVRRVEQLAMAEPTECTLRMVGGEDTLAEGSLVNADTQGRGNVRTAHRSGEILVELGPRGKSMRRDVCDRLASDSAETSADVAGVVEGNGETQSGDGSGRSRIGRARRSLPQRQMATISSADVMSTRSTVAAIISRA